MKLKDAKYFGIKLSPNRIKNDKGQLIVTGCEFARTGKQKYHSSELGLKDDKFIYLDRPAEEVSDPKTVASFEGAPVTLDHPEDDVKVGVNYNELSKGFATNVKYVAINDKEGYLKADFVITDPDLIKKIENHEIEELSAGYNCDVDESDWVQRHIRGNHIAVVEQARAGHQARLRDKAYKSTSKSQKTLKIGDSVVKIADSYSYELEEDGKKVKYTDYYTLTDSGKKKLVATLKYKPIKDKKLKDWTEEGDMYRDIIDRELFASLERLGNGKYVILIDLNPKDWIYAESDEEAKTKFRQWLRNRNSNINDSGSFELDEDDEYDDNFVVKRTNIDNDLQEIFSDSCFSVEGFPNGNDSDEGSIYVVDINPWLDERCYNYVEDNYEEDFDEEYLELACEYFENLIRNRIGDKYYVESIDVDVTDWSGEEEFPIDAHIYCRGVTR